MDQLAQSAKFKQLRENVAPVDDEEEEVRDVLVLMFFFLRKTKKVRKPEGCRFFWVFFWGLVSFFVV